MEKLVIKGGRPLKGKVTISGAKNATVAIIPAALLANGVCTLENLPMIKDVVVLREIIEQMGARVSFSENGTMKIDASRLEQPYIDNGLVKELRASYYLLGALLARFGRVTMAYPGGCDIGVRPIDQHIKGFKALGAEVEIEHGMISVKADKLVGNEIFLDVVSVGATINIMIAATMAEGTTIIENAAKEPHVVDVASFLNSIGAEVKGAGTDVIKIKGKSSFYGSTYMVIPDQIEAGTYMIAAASIPGGDVTINNVIPKHLDSITAKLIEMGAEVQVNGESIRVMSNDRLKSVDVKTLPYPGFPTDLQQPMTSTLTVANGISMVTESIWEGRFKHVDELKRMGANIKVEGRVAVIEGTDVLTGARVSATDLRAGAALVIAGLLAQGETEVVNLFHIDRGYENIEGKLRDLGADIVRKQL
ncbi:MAG: UDP-N-acetylglucosamine 1-carboxyvinyltransferase [Firmicutes bacterium]|nr:UDP-N-acetylglucosamine 1-carboxyvinyltransferase [Bacillota bacterium]MDI6705026.1 UDP-N-acetylglucosamine 1-carboxyvinyltransferase [Bacillota bacterium]